MNIRSKLIHACMAVIPLWASGCVIVAVDHGCWSWGGPWVWTEATEERPIDTVGLTALEVVTHNGAVDFQSQPADGAASVTITKKAGGTTRADAEEALAAIDVFVEPTGSGKTRIGWKWNTPKKSQWSGDVSFAIRAPGTINLDVETHNGAIAAAEVTGEVLAVSHNGQVTVRSSGPKVTAESHNGDVDVKYAGPQVNVNTHNGEASVDLSGCAAVTGSIISHNGEVRLSVGKDTAATLKFRTYNGGIHCDAPLTDREKSAGRLTGKLGSGGGILGVETHNGSIRVKNAAG